MLATKRPHKPDQRALTHLDALLDEALQQTFPASDPIAVTIELQVSGLGANSRVEMHAAQTQPHGVSDS